MTGGALNSRIRAQAVLPFFLLAFAISWAFWIAAHFIDGGNQTVFSMVTLLGASGPALSAILVASVLNPEPSEASGRRRLIVFLRVFVATYFLQV